MFQKIKNIILGLIGAYSIFQMINASLSGTSAIHQIYGAAMTIVLTLCIGFAGGGKE